MSIMPTQKIIKKIPVSSVQALTKVISFKKECYTFVSTPYIRFQSPGVWSLSIIVVKFLSWKLINARLTALSSRANRIHQTFIQL